MDTVWKPKGGRMSRGVKSHCCCRTTQRQAARQVAVSSEVASSQDKSTTAGSRDAMCVRRAFKTQYIEMWLLVSTSVIPFCKNLGRGLLRTNRVVSSAEKVVGEGRSSSHVSCWNLMVNLSSDTFVVGH